MMLDLLQVLFFFFFFSKVFWNIFRCFKIFFFSLYIAAASLVKLFLESLCFCPCIFQAQRFQSLFEGCQTRYTECLMQMCFTITQDFIQDYKCFSSAGAVVSASCTLLLFLVKTLAAPLLFVPPHFHFLLTSLLFFIQKWLNQESATFLIKQPLLDRHSLIKKQPGATKSATTVMINWWPVGHFEVVGRDFSDKWG